MNLHRVYMLVAALRTGVIQGENGAIMSIEQGTSTLERNYANGTKQQCCLGVACYVARLNGLPLQIKGPQYPFVDPENISEYRPTYFGKALETSWMTSEVTEWYGFADQDGSPHLELLGESAASANDNGYSFADIADGFEDLIRRELGLTPLVIADHRRCQHHEGHYMGMRLVYDGPRCGYMAQPGKEWCTRHQNAGYFEWRAQQAVEQVAAETGEDKENPADSIPSASSVATTEETEWDD